MTDDVTVNRADLELALDCFDPIETDSDTNAAFNRLSAALVPVTAGDGAQETLREWADREAPPCPHGVPIYERCATCDYAAAAPAPVGEAQDAPTFGHHVQDGGEWGTIIRCHECGGTGQLHQLDAENDAPTSDGLRDDLARALCANQTWPGPWETCDAQADHYKDADAVLPVVEAAVTTATETLRAEKDAAHRAFVDARASWLAARGEVAAARTEGFNAALDAVLARFSHEAVPYGIPPAIEALRLPTQGETK